MLEIKSTDDLQSSRLNTIETLDKTQNERLNAIESVNATQTERLNEQTAAAIKVSEEQAARDSLQEKALEDAVATIRKEESERAAAEKTAQEEVDKNQTDAFNKFKEDQEKIDSAQNTAIRKAEEWQDENHDNKSLQTFIAEMVQQEVNDILAANSKIDTTKTDLSNTITAKEKALSDSLKETKAKLDKTAEDLATTTAKATQLEGLLSLYAKKNSADPTFKLSVGGQDRTGNDITYIIAGNSVNVSYEVTDDPNWSASAYSDLQVNSDIIHATSYVATVSENLTLKYKNTLTDRETPARSIQFFIVEKPNQDPTQPDWVTHVDDTSLSWTTNLHTLTDSAETANEDKVLSYTKHLQYSTDSTGNSWTTFNQGSSLETVFGDSIQSANFRYYWKATDVAGNFVEAPVSLGSLNRSQACRTETTYSIQTISSSWHRSGTNLASAASSTALGALNGTFEIMKAGAYIASFANDGLTLTLTKKDDPNTTISFSRSGSVNNTYTYYSLAEVEESQSSTERDYIQITVTPTTTTVWYTIN